MISKTDLTRIMETIEILGNSETMRQVRLSEQDILTKKTKKVIAVKDLLAEMA